MHLALIFFDLQMITVFLIIWINSGIVETNKEAGLQNQSKFRLKIIDVPIED